MPLSDLHIPYFAAPGLRLLFDGDYLLALHAQLQRARSSVDASLFLADVRPAQDAHRSVRGLLHALGEAAWRGVRVRVLLSPFQSDSPALDINRVAQRFLHARGVPVRTFRPQPKSQRDSLHTKLLVFDQRLCITGSHNWTQGALNQNLETSVLVESTDLAQHLGAVFEQQWLRGEASLERI